jgi:pyruvate kinase
MIRTKIVATMGPACNDVALLHQLFDAGVDVCRLNFSHGTLEQHGRMLLNIREAAIKFAQPIAVLGDLGGPKIRLGQVRDIAGTGGMPIAVGEELFIQRQPTTGENFRVSTTYKNFVDDVSVGDRILIEDGLLRFVSTDKNFNEVKCSCTVGGILKTAKGINLPNTVVNVPSVTERDWECVHWAIENDLDYLALSFVRKPDELNLVREALRNQSSNIALIAKIEKNEAVHNIDAIIEAADGLMIARGDLGVEMDVAEVPIIQKDLIRRCQTAGKPVIVATQMLQSMIEQSSPTRAEVSDVANAIFDGTDAVMLSGETSVGKYPTGAVLTMTHIAKVTECYLTSSGQNDHLPQLKLKTMQLSAAIATGVRQMVSELRARVVVIYSQTGATARIFSKHRFPVPIIALSSDHAALRRMALHYGVIPCEMAPSDDLVELVARVDRLVQEEKHADAGDRVIIVAGASLGTPGTMNGIVVHTVGEHWSPTMGS